MKNDEKANLITIPQNEMPLEIWVWGDATSIGDMGFTVTKPKEGHIKYLLATHDKVLIDRAVLEGVRECLMEICRRSLYDRNWESDGKDYGKANKALHILEAAMKGEG